MARILLILILTVAGALLGCQNRQLTSGVVPRPNRAVQLSSSIPKEAIQSAIDQLRSNTQGAASGLPAEESWLQKKSDQIERPADSFLGQAQSGYRGYTIERRLRKALLEYSDEGNSSRQWVDVAYVNVKKAGKVLRKFDADVWFGLGNSASFGFFPFLGKDTKQLFISQDVPRGGCQWVVSLSPSFRVIFNGNELAVGREGSDFGVIDLDNDGVYEIIAPITGFYEFQDEMSMADIPLPDIIFRYHPTKENYLPANSMFKAYLLQDLQVVPQIDTLEHESEHRSVVLSNLLIHIYAGEQKKGWVLFDKDYQLDDKQDMQRRIKRILRRQPVYNLIYNHGKRK